MVGVDAGAVAVAAGGGGDVTLMGIEGGEGVTAAAAGVAALIGRARRVSAGPPRVARVTGESARGGGVPLAGRGWAPRVA